MNSFLEENSNTFSDRQKRTKCLQKNGYENQLWTLFQNYLTESASIGFFKLLLWLLKKIFKTGVTIYWGDPKTGIGVFEPL